MNEGFFRDSKVSNKSINKIANQNFFNFNKTEQYSIIDYYINYYLILLYISYTHEPLSTLLFKDIGIRFQI